MPSKLLGNKPHELTATALDVAWRQWHAIGATATVRDPATSVVDPEALMLFTLQASQREPRFESLLFSWLEVNASLVSVQRMRNLQKVFPPQLRPQVQRFSQIAREVAKHPKWSALGDGDDHSHESHALPDVRRAVRSPLRRSGALLLRLRQALGLGAKADILAVLLGQAGHPLTVKEIVDLTSYTNVAVRGAIDDLTRAGFTVALSGRPVRYAAPAKEWGSLLGLRSMPAWHPWAQFYAFVIAYEELSGQARAGDFSEYAANSKLRDLVEENQMLFEQMDHDRTLNQGDALEMAQGSVTRLARWAARSA
jgi:hypothetical protein